MIFDGNLITQYISLKAATEKTNITNISAVCRGVLRQAGGFKWKYLQK